MPAPTVTFVQTPDGVAAVDRALQSTSHFGTLYEALCKYRKGVLVDAKGAKHFVKLETTFVVDAISRLCDAETHLLLPLYHKAQGNGFGISFYELHHRDGFDALLNKSSSSEERVSMLRDIEIAITWLHGNGFTFHDVKAENTVVDSDGHLKFCDICSVEGEHCTMWPGLYVGIRTVKCISTFNNLKLYDLLCWATMCAQIMQRNVQYAPHVLSPLKKWTPTAFENELHVLRMALTGVTIAGCKRCLPGALCEFLNDRTIESKALQELQETCRKHVEQFLQHVTITAPVPPPKPCCDPKGILTTPPPSKRAKIN